MFNVPMVDLAESPAEAKKQIAEMTAASPVATVSKYPYGTCISLEDDTLKKLGDAGDEMPKVGEMVAFCAVAKITSSNENEREAADGTTKTCRRVELQIMQMGLQFADPVEKAVAASASRRRRFYGDAAADED